MRASPATLCRRRLAGVLRLASDRKTAGETPAPRIACLQLHDSRFHFAPSQRLEDWGQDVSPVFHESVIASCYTECFLGGVPSARGCKSWRTDSEYMDPAEGKSTLLNSAEF